MGEQILHIVEQMNHEVKQSRELVKVAVRDIC